MAVPSQRARGAVSAAVNADRLLIRLEVEVGELAIKRLAEVDARSVEERDECAIANTVRACRALIHERRELPRFEEALVVGFPGVGRRDALA